MLPGADEHPLANEAPEMRRARNEPARPYGGHEYELIHAGPEGSCWRASHGVEVRIAAAEREREQDLSTETVRARIPAGATPAIRALFGAVFAR